MKKRNFIISSVITLIIVAGIFTPVVFSIKQNRSITTQIQTAHATNPAVATTTRDKLYNGLSCGVGFMGDSSLIGCVAELAYYIPYKLGSFALTLSAWCFDTVANLSLQSNFYTDSSFISDGWRIVRDFANMFFIFILLYIAISLVLGLGDGHGNNPKKMFVSVVIIAILINFSFFVTSVVIDITNSLALVFYNQITVTSRTTTTESANMSGQISTALVQSFQPAIFESDEFWKKFGPEDTSHSVLAWSGIILLALIPGANVLTGTLYHATAIPSIVIPPVILLGLFIMIGAMYGVLAYSFFIATLSFVGRMAVLGTSLIFAPFAFVTYIVPSLQGTEGFGWKKWWEQLSSAAIAAPIYFFFLLLISIFAKSVTIPSPDGASSGWFLIILIFVIYAFLIVLILKATKYAEKAGGEIGAAVIKYGSMAAKAVGGVALGAAVGGVALAGQSTIGAGMKAVGSRLKDNKTLNAWADGKAGGGKFGQWAGKKFGQAAINTGKAAEEKGKTGSFDLRHTGLANKFTKATGIQLGMNEKFLGVGVGALGSNKTAGGLESRKIRKAAKTKEKMEKLGYNKQKDKEIDNSINENNHAKADNTKKQNELKEHQKPEREALAKAETEAKAAETEALKKINDQLVADKEAENQKIKNAEAVIPAIKNAVSVKVEVKEREVANAEKNVEKSEKDRETARKDLEFAKANPSGLINPSTGKYANVEAAEKKVATADSALVSAQNEVTTKKAELAKEKNDPVFKVVEAEKALKEAEEKPTGPINPATGKAANVEKAEADLKKANDDAVADPKTGIKAAQDNITQVKADAVKNTAAAETKHTSSVGDANAALEKAMKKIADDRGVLDNQMKLLQDEANDISTVGANLAKEKDLNRNHRVRSFLHEEKSKKGNFKKLTETINGTEYVTGDEASTDPRDKVRGWKAHLMAHGSSVAKFAGLGAIVGGPVGAGIGAGVGYLKSVFSDAGTDLESIQMAEDLQFSKNEKERIGGSAILEAKASAISKENAVYKDKHKQHEEHLEHKIKHMLEASEKGGHGGGHPADGGHPPADGGHPPADGGHPPADGGHPPAH